MRYCSLLLLLGLFFTKKPAIAQQRNLSFYIEQAKVNSPVIKDNKNQKEATSVEAERLRALFTKPTVSLTANYLLAPAFVTDNGKNQLQLNPKDPTNYYGYEIGATNGGVYKALLNIDQPLWNAGRYKTTAEQAFVSAQMNENNIQLTTHEIEKLVTDQYILSLQDYKQTVYLRELLQIIIEQQSIIEKLVNGGIAKQSDLTLLNIERQTQLTALNTYQANYNRDVQDLNVLCGIKDTAYQLLPDIQLPLSASRDSSSFLEKYKLDSLNLVTAQKIFELKYKPQLGFFANTGLNATYIPTLPNRFGVSAGLNFTMVLADGKQKRLNQRKTDILIRSTQSYKDNFVTQNDVRKSKILAELKATQSRFALVQEQLKEYSTLLESYKAELIKGQLSVINYTNVLKNVAALQRDYILMQTNQQLLINAYNYWNW